MKNTNYIIIIGILLIIVISLLYQVTNPKIFINNDLINNQIIRKEKVVNLYYGDNALVLDMGINTQLNQIKKGKID